MDAINVDTLRVSIPRDQVLGEDLFPMPISAMERFMIWDHSEQYPSWFRIELALEGQLNKPVYAKALQIALARHAMLLACFRLEQGTEVWDLAPMTTLHVTQRQESPETIECDSMETEGGVGLVHWIVTDSDRVTLGFDVNHSRIDGQGIRTFLRDLLLAYHQLCADGSDESVSLPLLDPSKLLVRHSVVRPPTSARSRPTNTWEKIRQAFLFHTCKPLRLRGEAIADGFTRSNREVRVTREVIATREIGPNISACSPAIFRNVFSSEETIAIHQVLRRERWLLNDVAVTLMIQTTLEWSETAGSKLPIRVMVPCDLRRKDDRTLPGCNKLSFSFVVGERKHSRTFEATYELVRKQTQRIHGLQLAFDFAETLEALNKSSFLRVRLKKSLEKDRTLATAVLTNTGDASRRIRKLFAQRDGKPLIGNLIFHDIIGIPPLRRGTAWGVGITESKNALSIASHLDLNELGGNGRELHHRYMDAWRNWLSDSIACSHDVDSTSGEIVE